MTKPSRVSARTLVTGANGFVGRAIVERLARDGRDVLAVSRSHADWGPGITARQCADPSVADWAHDLAGVDTVVHSAARTHVTGRAAHDTGTAFRAVNVDLTLAIARGAVAAGVRRLIFLSSAHVNGTRTDTAPFRVDMLPRPANDYARSKWVAEQGLADIARDTGLEVVVIRPPLVIGRDPKGNLGTLVAAMRRGWPLPLGAVKKNRRDLVSLDTLADLIAHALDHPDAPGVPLLVSDGRALSTRSVVERLATLHGLTARLVPVPVALLGAGLGLLGRRSLAAQLLGNLEIDMGETCRRLDWRPPAGAEAS